MVIIKQIKPSTKDYVEKKYGSKDCVEKK